MTTGYLRILVCLTAMVLFSSCSSSGSADGVDGDVLAGDLAGDSADPDLVRSDSFSQDSNGDLTEPDVALPDPQWARLELPTAVDVVSIFGFAADDVWFGGMNRLFHYDGKGFSETQILTGEVVEDIYGLSPDDVWAVCQHHVLRFNGTKWDSVDAPLDGRNAYSVWISPSGKVWIGGIGGLLLSFDGSSFKDEHTPEVGLMGIKTVWGTSDSDIWIGGATKIAHFDGTSWSVSAAISLAGWVTASEEIWSSAPDRVWSVGQNGQILQFNGALWTQVQGGSFGPTLTGIWGTAPDDIWVVGNGNVIIRSDGLHWSTLTIDDSANHKSVWGLAPDNVWIGGAGGELWHYSRPAR